MIEAGSKVKMNNKYYVSEKNRDKTFTVISEPWEVCGSTVVRLDGFSSCYALDGLTEVKS